MGHLKNTPGAFNRIAFGDVSVITQNHRSDRIPLEVERQPKGIAGELDHFALHGIFEPVKASDTIGDTDYGAFVACLGCNVQLFNALFDQLADFGWIQCRLHYLFPM